MAEVKSPLFGESILIYLSVEDSRMFLFIWHFGGFVIASMATYTSIIHGIDLLDFSYIVFSSGFHVVLYFISCKFQL